MMRFSPNDSPNNLVFGDVKKFQKFKGYHSAPARQFSTGTLIVLRKTNTLAASKMRAALCSLLRQLVATGWIASYILWLNAKSGTV